MAARELERGYYLAVLDDDGASVVRYYPANEIEIPNVDRRDFIKAASATAAAAAVPVVATPAAAAPAPKVPVSIPESVAHVPTITGPVADGPMSGLVIHVGEENWSAN